MNNTRYTSHALQEGREGMAVTQTGNDHRHKKDFLHRYSEREEKLADNTTSCLCNWEDTWPFDHNEISEGKEEEGAALSAKLPGW